MLEWSPPPPLEVNGAIRHYTVEATERHTGRQWIFFAVDADLHIGSLHPFYYYDIKVSATTVRMGPFSTVYSVLTLPERELVSYVLHPRTVIYNYYDIPKQLPQLLRSSYLQLPRPPLLSLSPGTLHPSRTPMEPSNTTQFV